MGLGFVTSAESVGDVMVCVCGWCVVTNHLILSSGWCRHLEHSRSYRGSSHVRSQWQRQ